MKTRLIQTNFTAGEVSPHMLGRVDTARYTNGVAAATNQIARPQGPLVRRTGTKFIAAVKDSSNAVIIRKFEFSDQQAYVLEIGEKYIRIYYDGGFVETAPLSGTPLEVVTPYLATDLSQLQFCQSADILYITHRSYPPQKLERLGANSWTMISLDNQDGPYLADFNSDQSITLTVSSYSSTATATTNNNVFTGALAVNVTSIGSFGGAIYLTATAHGLTTGQTVALKGLSATIGAGVDISKSPFNYGVPYGNGNYVVTVNDVNHVTLNGSIYGTLTFGSATYPITYSTVGTTIGLVTATGPFIEYRENNQWKLAQITNVLTAKSATVKVIPYIKFVSSAVIITTTTSGIKSDHSGVFTTSDIGNYIRLTSGPGGAGSWYRITDVSSDSVMIATSVALTTYTYPTTKVTVSTSQITCTLTSNTANTFVATDLRRCVRLNFGGTQCWGRISGYTSGTVVALQLFQPVPLDPTNVDSLYGAGITSVWKLGAWSTASGWPRTCCFHQQRLCFFGSDSEPQNMWMSQSQDYENFAPTSLDTNNVFSTSQVADNCAITYTLVSNEANPITWAQSGPVLLIGTTNGEWQVKAASATVSAITPTNINVTPQTNHGSKQGVTPYRVGYAILFVQKAGRKLIEMTYEFNLDSYVGKDLTVVSDHIFRKGGSAIAMCYQQEPNSVLWFVLSDGTMAALTYDRDQQVNAWHSHSLGGAGKVESICSVPSTAGTEDLVYVLVNRTINSTTKRYIEQLTPDFYPTATNDTAKMWFLDCALQYTGAPTTSVTGLIHLQNETVTVVSNGTDIGALTVSNTGVLTLPAAASNVVVGYGYQSTMQILPLDGGSKDGGTAQGKNKRVGRTVVRVYNSRTFKYGTALDALDTIDSQSDDQTFTGFFTGDLICNMPQDYNLTGQFYFVQDKAYPMTVLSIMPDVEVTT